MKLDKPKNQWAQAVYLLLENKKTGVTMVEAMKDYFHKFQTRLYEVEKGRKDKIRIKKTPVTKKNRFNHGTTFMNYKSDAPVPYLVNLVNKLNKHGVKALKAG